MRRTVFSSCQSSRLTLSSGEAAYRRAKFAPRRNAPRRTLPHRSGRKRISPQLPSRVFRAGGVCWRGRPSASGFRAAEGALLAGTGRLPGAARRAHLPAFAVSGNGASGCSLGGWPALRRPLSGESGVVFHRGISPQLRFARLRRVSVS